MSKYYEQTHAHKGIDKDGSSQISYTNLTDKPTIEELLSGFSRVAVIQSTNQTGITTATWTRVTNFGTPSFDTQSEFASNRFTATNAGRYLFDGQSSVTFGAVTGREQISLYINGASAFQYISQKPIVASTTNFMDFTFSVDLSAGDYVDLYYYQSSGGSVSTNAPFFSWTVTRLL